MYPHTSKCFCWFPPFGFTWCGSSVAVHHQKLDGGLDKTARIIRCWSSCFINISSGSFWPQTQIFLCILKPFKGRKYSRRSLYFCSLKKEREKNQNSFVCFFPKMTLWLGSVLDSFQVDCNCFPTWSKYLWESLMRSCRWPLVLTYMLSFLQMKQRGPDCKMSSFPNNSISGFVTYYTRFVVTRGGGVPRVWMCKVTSTVVEPQILSHSYSGSQKSQITTLT